MKRLPVVLIMLLIGVCLAAAETTITLPIRFHITQGAKMTVKGKVMENWVLPADLTGPVLAEVNRIWKPAGIQFVVERAQVEALLKPANFAELIQVVENSKRGEEEVAGSGRTAAIGKLLDPSSAPPDCNERVSAALYRRHLSGVCESRR